MSKRFSISLTNNDPDLTIPQSMLNTTRVPTNVRVEKNSKSCPSGYTVIYDDLNKDIRGKYQALCVKYTNTDNLKKDSMIIDNITMEEETKSCPLGYETQEEAPYIGMSARSTNQKLCIHKIKKSDLDNIVTDVYVVTGGAVNNCDNTSAINIGDTRKGAGGDFRNICIKKSNIPKDTLCKQGSNIDTVDCRIYCNKNPDWCKSFMTNEYCQGTKLTSNICQEYIKSQSDKVPFFPAIEKFCKNKGVTIQNLSSQNSLIKELCSCRMPRIEYENAIKILKEKFPNIPSVGNGKCLIDSCAGGNDYLDSNVQCNTNNCMITSEYTGGQTIDSNIKVNQQCNFYGDNSQPTTNIPSVPGSSNTTPSSIEQEPQEESDKPSQTTSQQSKVKNLIIILMIIILITILISATFLML